MKRGLFSTLCFVAASVVNSASAADLPVKARIAPLPPVFSWTGCYFGVNAGGVWGSASDNWTANPLPGAFNGPAFISANGSNTMTGSSFVVGGQIGCNYQAGQFVLGVEGDLDSSDLRGARDFATLDFAFGLPRTFHSDFNERWLSTVRGRFGVTFGDWFGGNWLVYGTGGVAVANLSYTDTLLFPLPNIMNTASVSMTRAGYAAGAGIELALSPNWSIRGEYLFVDILGPDSLLNNLPGEPLATVNATHELKQHIGRAALNYKFDWGR